jgi:hypothetical protein
VLISNFSMNLTKLALILVVLYTAFVDISFLPDYYSYERIFLESESGGGWEIAFVAFCVLLNNLGVEYSQFRIIVSIIGFLFLVRIVNPSFKVNSYGRGKSFLSFGWLLVPLVVVMIFLEYYVIRIRGGLGAAVFLTGFFLLMRDSLIFRVCGFILLGSSFLFHLYTALMLSIFILFPYSWCYFHKYFFVRHVPYVFACLLVSVLFFVAFHSGFSARGEHLFSPLHPFRLFCLAVVPFLFFMVGLKERIPLGSEADLRFYDVFPFYFVRLYLALCFSLTIYVLLGFAPNSGEALVRVFTAASFPALVSLLLKGGPKGGPISMYIVSCNALFFGATLWL